MTEARSEPEVYTYEAPTPLMEAIYDGDKESVQELIDGGADVNASNRTHGTPLIVAVGQRDQEVIELLRSAGANAGVLDQHYQETFTFRDRCDGTSGKVEFQRVSTMQGVSFIGHGAATTMYEVHLSEDRIDSFLRNSDLKRAGWFLFRTEYVSPIGQESEIVGLLPTKDKYAVIAYVGTRSSDKTVTPYRIIRWLQHHEPGCKLLGAGRRFLELDVGRTPVGAEARAKSIYEFCPNIVDKSELDFDALVYALQEKPKLRLTWD